MRSAIAVQIPAPRCRRNADRDEPFLSEVAFWSVLTEIIYAVHDVSALTAITCPSRPTTIIAPLPAGSVHIIVNPEGTKHQHLRSVQLICNSDGVFPVLILKHCSI